MHTRCRNKFQGSNAELDVGTSRFWYTDRVMFSRFRERVLASTNAALTSSPALSSQFQAQFARFLNIHEYQVCVVV